MEQTTKNPTRLVIEIAPEKRRALKVAAAERGTTIKAIIEECIDKVTATRTDAGKPEK